jgi:RHS repeat-associated protein
MYSVASLPTQVNLGSSDDDSFTYDPNTNRMTQYEFTVNSQSVIGKLTWNAIGTLETLVVIDPFYGADNQTCAYTHDDMSRIASANCGSPWSQTFSYGADGTGAFGNLSKSGTTSFQPTYSPVTNRITTVGSSTATYDSNGNATNDTLHTYAWDAAGRPVTADSVGLTYDALGRMVEQNRSGVYSEIVYTPLGNKFTIMNGSTLSKAFVPLTGGLQAVYNSSGLSYYRHSDWIGSSRLASTPSRAMYYDGAYAPFGEAYAQTGTSDLSFTGMNQDVVPNLYDFPFREYNNIHGRWPSPDPAGIVAVTLTDPQSWNRYAYVRNSPLSFVDPLGLYCVWDDGSIDDDPQNGGATMGECVGTLDDQGNGGTWYDGTSPGFDPDPNQFLADQIAAMNGNLDNPDAPVIQSLTQAPFLTDPASTTSGDSDSWFTSNFGTNPAQVTMSGPPKPNLSRSDKYVNFLTCEAAEDVDLAIGDDGKAGAFTILNVAAAAGAMGVASRYLRFNPIYYLVTASIYDLSIELRANATCTQQVYGAH